MKKLIFGILAILLLSVLSVFSAPCYADITITIKNESGLNISVFIDSVDHGLNKFGSQTIFEGHLKSDESIAVLVPYNNPPHRYIFSTLYKGDKGNAIFYNIEIAYINPSITNYIFLIKDKEEIQHKEGK
jgi:hypothetical protein